MAVLNRLFHNVDDPGVPGLDNEPGGGGTWGCGPGPGPGPAVRPVEGSFTPPPPGDIPNGGGNLLPPPGVNNGGGVMPGSLLLLAFDEFRFEMLGIRKLCLFVDEDIDEVDSLPLLVPASAALRLMDVSDMDTDVSLVAKDLSNGFGSKSNVVFS